MPYTSKTGQQVPDFSVKPHRWVHGELAGCKLCNPCVTACAPLAPCAGACMGCARCKFGACAQLCDPVLKPCKAACDPHIAKCKAGCEPHCAKCKAGCEPHCAKCKATCDKLPKCPPACAACAGSCMACKCNPECIKCMDDICLKLRGPCKPVCTMCKGLDSVCDAGPGCECKTVGCELTCGVPAIEAQLGVWHIATDMFPSKLPAILYPLAFGGCPPCPGGKDEEMKGDNFSIGGPTTGETIKIFRFCCGSCSPYSMLKKSIWGLAIDPPFDGDTPAWYNATPDAGKGDVVSASNFGGSESDNFGSVAPLECQSSLRVPSQLAM
jgi:hypothetical protein